ncbi:MAG: hypothetical protein RLZZ501_2587 [Pseudomonadota bacterium]|jgi:predicted MFS family arabinose efflux permease
MNPAERRLALAVGLVQAVVAAEFVVIAPLGPWLVEALALPPSLMGLANGVYMAAAFVAGLALAAPLGRIGRRLALGGALVGLAAATVLGGLAEDGTTLILSRVLAGLCGGPAAALSLAALSNGIAAERRGRALALALGGISVATVIGVPLLLELAEAGGWRLAFLACAGLALAATGLILPALPRPVPTDPPPPLRALLARPGLRLAILLQAIALFQMFLVLPILVVWFADDLGLPRDRIGLLYLIAGLAGFAAMQLAGRLVDRWGGGRVAAAASVGLTLALGLMIADGGEPVASLFLLTPAMSAANAVRMIGLNALFLRLPRPGEQAAVMAVLSAAQHAAAGLGGFACTALITTGADGRLARMPLALGLAALAGLALPPLLPRLERRLER